jgi:hypothetical protein
MNVERELREAQDGLRPYVTPPFRRHSRGWGGGEVAYLVAVTRRRRAILSAALMGWSDARIADVLGVTVQRVALLRRQEERRLDARRGRDEVARG